MRDCRATEYTEYDTTDLEDGTVVRMAQHSFFKVSNLGGWISYTGNTHSDEEMAKILKSTITTTKGDHHARKSLQKTDT